MRSLGSIFPTYAVPFYSYITLYCSDSALLNAHSIVLYCISIVSLNLIIHSLYLPLTNSSRTFLEYGSLKYSNLIGQLGES
jgi:hypothetical protein